MGPAMDELKKNAIKMDGMPLLQYTSFGMTASGQSGSDGQNAQQPPPSQSSTGDNNTPSSPSGAIVKGLGGLFGKKKQQQSDSSAAPNPAAANNPPPPPPVPGSMMDMTIEVTSYSRDSLDASWFELPAGYSQVQPDASGK